MKKVGIVTWYWGNYGSILQAYALQKVVNDLGYDCETVQHCVRGSSKQKVLYRLKNLGLLKTFNLYIKKVESKIINRLNNESSSIRIREKKLNYFVNNNLRLSTKKYNDSNFKECNIYDAYVCGSDQIWNPNMTFFSDFYWLNFVNGKIKISYAPSIGNKKIPQQYKNKIRDMLADFNTITVREKVGENIINEILDDNKAVTVLDPTMLLNLKEWNKVVPARSIDNKYIFVYLLRATEEQLMFIDKLSSEFDLPIVTYPYLELGKHSKIERSFGNYRVFSDDPFDFLEKIKNAEIVITDSFHCSVFSTLFHSQFYVLKKSGDNTGQLVRLTNLLETTKQLYRLIDVDTNVADLRGRTYSFEKSDEIVEKMRESSLEILSDSLNLCF